MQRWSFNWVLACRGGVLTGCWHAEVGFDSLELGVGMQKWGSTALNCMLACRGGIRLP
jgi:hypothetical protein